MSRLLTFKLPLTYISSHRMSVPHAEFIQRSSVFFPFANSWRSRRSQVCLGIITTNNLCLSVCPCHKTLEIQIKTWLVHTHTFRIIHCLVSAARISCFWHNRATQTGNHVTTDLGYLSYDKKTEAQKCYWHFTVQDRNNEGLALKKKTTRGKQNDWNATAWPKRRTHVNLWCLLTLRNVCFVLNWQGTF